MLAMPRQPILWITPVTGTSLSTSAPFSSRRFGTQNSETPFMRAGAPADPRERELTMLSVRS